MTTTVLVTAYLSAVVLANLAIVAFGPAVSIPTAFLLIGLTITVRDRLHDHWKGGNHGDLASKMFLLIFVGGVISFALNTKTFPVALASLVAFVLAESTDALVYHKLRHKVWIHRANVSNSASALVDSLVFPIIAFGGFPVWIILGQYLAKLIGGFIWSYLIVRWDWYLFIEEI